MANRATSIRRVKAGLRQAYDEAARAYLTPQLRREREVPVTHGELNESSLQYAAALRAMNDAASREVLDVGTGLASWPRLLADCGFRVTAIDKYSKDSYWGRRPFNRHFLIQEDDITNPSLDREFDAVTCMNVMSTIPQDEPAFAGLAQLTRPGGLLVMSFPYNERRAVKNVYALPEAGYGGEWLFPCRVYNRADLDRWFARHPFEILSQTYAQVFSGELWTMGTRIPPVEVSVNDLHHFTILVLRKDDSAP